MRRGGGGHYILLFAAKESSTLYAKNGAAAAWQEWRRTHGCCQAAGLRARVFAIYATSPASYGPDCWSPGSRNSVSRS